MVVSKNCSKCGATFKCGTTEANGSCWCNTLPNIVPMLANQDCLCSDCLIAKIEEMQAQKAVLKGD